MSLLKQKVFNESKQQATYPHPKFHSSLLSNPYRTETEAALWSILLNNRADEGSGI